MMGPPQNKQIPAQVGTGSVAFQSSKQICFVYSIKPKFEVARHLYYCWSVLAFHFILTDSNCDLARGQADMQISRFLQRGCCIHSWKLISGESSLWSHLKWVRKVVEVWQGLPEPACASLAPSPPPQASALSTSAATHGSPHLAPSPPRLVSPHSSVFMVTYVLTSSLA